MNIEKGITMKKMLIDTTLDDLAVDGRWVDTKLHWVSRLRRPRTYEDEQLYLRMKRGIDLIVIFFSIPFLLPLFLLIFCLVKLTSPGAPALFIQWRTGKGGKRFKMYKFRTMVPNAEELKSSLRHLNELKWPDFKITNDPRVTTMGRLLRSTSLDELPQIWNVVIGDMSLVGPRPTSVAPDKYSLWQTKRFSVMPGITGLWQIIGRGTVQFNSKIRLDIAYINHRCLWLDIQILFRTVACVIKKKGRV